MRRAGLLVFLVVLAIPLAALAHPLGNFTINHHVAVTVGTSTFDVGYVIDYAEIPAFGEIVDLDTDGDGAPSVTELAGYASLRCSDLGDGLRLDLDGARLPLIATEAAASVRPGQSDVPTLRVECRYESQNAGRGLLSIENVNYPDRIGWAEIIVTSTSVPIETDLPSESQSGFLTAYPEGTLASTPEVRSGSVQIGAGDVTPGAASPLAALGSAFDTGEAGFVPALLAIGAAFVLGVGHALAPGHGKTIVAAYLVGTRGTARQALVLAGSTAISHTAGVAILGLIAAGASVAFEPADLYPYLSTISGAVILAIGARLLWLALRSSGQGHDHAHVHGRGHDHHHKHQHDAPDEHHDHRHEQPHHGKPALGWKAVAALGLSGGLVPSASAVVLLLGAVQLGKAWFGVLLVAAFGVGMAAALVGSGLLAVAAHRLGWKWMGERGPGRKLWRWVPASAASAVVVLGLLMTILAVVDLSAL